MQQPAESEFAVGLSNRTQRAGIKLSVTAQLAVVGVSPVAAPQFAGKRVGIFQRHFAAVSLTDMRDHRAGFDGVFLNQAGDGRIKTRMRILKGAATITLVEGNAPAIFMRASPASTLHQPTETETDISRNVGAHPEQFAHRQPPLINTIIRCTQVRKGGIWRKSGVYTK